LLPNSLGEGRGHVWVARSFARRNFGPAARDPLSESASRCNLSFWGASRNQRFDLSAPTLDVALKNLLIVTPKRESRPTLERIV